MNASIRPLASRALDPSLLRTKQRENGATAFAAVLSDALAEQSVHFSGHALERMRQRGIQLNDAQRLQLEEAMHRLSEKGVKQALVLLQDAALIVSVPNKTVITLMNKEELADTVFTNIDGAVLAPAASASSQRADKGPQLL